MNSYKKRTELNGNKSPFTGNIVALHTRSPKKFESEIDMSLIISDCYHTIRLHSESEELEHVKEYLKKLKKLRNAIKEYEIFLKKEYKL